MTMEYALGRTLADSDLATLATLADGLPAGSATLHDVLRTFVINDAFLVRGPLE